MELHELVLEMEQLERRLALCEEKYGILSQDFYNILRAGKLSAAQLVALLLGASSAIHLLALQRPPHRLALVAPISV